MNAPEHLGRLFGRCWQRDIRPLDGNHGPDSAGRCGGRAVVFAPSFALVASLWTESSRPFDALHLALRYVGPSNGGVVINFVGVTARGISTEVPLAFTAAGIAAVMMVA